MNTLHIVQGGIENGDKAWLERAARNRLSRPSWVVPKSVAIGDELVVYVGGYGFFATARIDSRPKARDDWPNRYGAGITSVQLIDPAISLAAIRRGIPDLTWANYPRSITTPEPNVADQIRKLIEDRRKRGVSDLDDDALAKANIDELRSVALLRAEKSATPRRREAIFRARSQAIRRYVLSRANGHCEGCGEPAPFCKADRSPYLEPHHIDRLADDGPDHPARVIGLCPNCHRKAHYSEDADAFNRILKRRLRSLESQ